MSSGARPRRHRMLGADSYARFDEGIYEAECEMQAKDAERGEMR